MAPPKPTDERQTHWGEYERNSRSQGTAAPRHRATPHEDEEGTVKPTDARQTHWGEYERNSRNLGTVRSKPVNYKVVQIGPTHALGRPGTHRHTAKGRE